MKTLTTKDLITTSKNAGWSIRYYANIPFLEWHVGYGEYIPVDSRKIKGIFAYDMSYASIEDYIGDGDARFNEEVTLSDEEAGRLQQAFYTNNKLVAKPIFRERLNSFPVVEEEYKIKTKVLLHIRDGKLKITSFGPDGSVDDEVKFFHPDVDDKIYVEGKARDITMSLEHLEEILGIPEIATYRPSYEGEFSRGILYFKNPAVDIISISLDKIEIKTLNVDKLSRFLKSNNEVDDLFYRPVVLSTTGVKKPTEYLAKMARSLKRLKPKTKSYLATIGERWFSDMLQGLISWSYPHIEIKKGGSRYFLAAYPYGFDTNMMKVSIVRMDKNEIHDYEMLVVMDDKVDFSKSLKKLFKKLHKKIRFEKLERKVMEKVEELEKLPKEEVIKIVEGFEVFDISDSTAVGNCEPGTISWAKSLGINDLSISGKDLAQKLREHPERIHRAFLKVLAAKLLSQSPES